MSGSLGGFINQRYRFDDIKILVQHPTTIYFYDPHTVKSGKQALQLIFGQQAFLLYFSGGGLYSGGLYMDKNLHFKK